MNKPLSILVLMVVLLSIPTAMAINTGIDYNEEKHMVVAYFYNTEEVTIHVNGTMNLPGGQFETFTFSLKPKEKIEFFFKPTKAGTSHLIAEYSIGEHPYQISLRIRISSEEVYPKKTPGFDIAIGIVAIFAIAIIRRNKK